MGYSWDIRMYRVCVGYVSGMCREYVERNWVREMKLTTMVTTGAAINTLPRYEGDGLDSICRRLGENKLLRAEREKSKLSKPNIETMKINNEDNGKQQ